jgi:hypothetical protein
MKALDEIRVSVYEDLRSKRPTECSFLDVLNQCIRDTHASQVATIRRFFDDGDPHTVAVLESPTDGLKIFAYVEGIEGRHLQGVRLVAEHYNHLLKLQNDPACKDESRLCFFTHSPNGYTTTLYTPFVLTEEQSEEQLGEHPEELPPPTGKPQAKSTTEEDLSSLIFKYPLIEGERHSNLFKIACAAARKGWDREMTCDTLWRILQGSDFPKSELEKTICDGFQSVNIHPKQKENSGKRKEFPPLPPLPPYDAPILDEEKEEAYWEGEELRKKTPVFDDSLFDNLPGLIEDAQVDEITPRERDIALLSQFVCLSAILPCTFGIYRRHKYTPHLFGLVIAPAGSGKSIVQTGRYLIEGINEQILRESIIADKQYNADRTRWMNECSRKRKTGEEVPEEPQKPPFKMLIISASTSYTRMQIQLQDNGPLGGLIFDTEAQTLSTANHLDCGNFDDMLRKAFEHEHIDSSYKANGMKPIYIRNPRLALLLTGTPGQVDKLISSSENGLVSRVLFYTYRENPHWQEVGEEHESLEDQFKTLADRTGELYRFCSEHPVLFHFTQGQWNTLNNTFKEKLEEVSLEQNDDLQAVVKRYCFIVMRLSMIQARIRQFEQGNIDPDIYCTDTDFRRALSLVLCCYEHSRLLLSSMSRRNVNTLKSPDKIRGFFNDLPMEFTTANAVALGEQHKLSKRKVERLLSSVTGLKINKLSRGVYKKMQE